MVKKLFLKRFPFDITCHKKVYASFFAKRCLISSKEIASYRSLNVTIWQYSHQMGLPVQKSWPEQLFFKICCSKKAIFQSNKFTFWVQEWCVRGNAFHSILSHQNLCEELEMKFALYLSLLRAAWKLLNNMTVTTSICGTWSASIHSKSPSHHIALQTHS